MSGLRLRARPQSPYLAPPDNVVAIRAGRMFDAKAGTMLNNQIILIKGDRIADMGPSVQIPAWGTGDRSRAARPSFQE